VPDATAPATPPAPGDTDGRSDLRVVLQFFIVPLALVAVLVAVFFGLQFMRSRNPDPRATLSGLERYEGFLAAWVGDLKRWQYGYDLSVLLRDPERRAGPLVPELARAFAEAGARRDVPLRRYLALVLGKSANPAAAAPLRAGLGDPDAHTRLFCAWGLMNLGDRSALAGLRAALADPDAGVRKAAIFALGELGDADAAPALVAALADPEADVRWNAALALARLDRPEGAAILVSLLEDNAFVPATRQDPGPRDRALNAIRGLARIRSDAARPLLARVREEAAEEEVRRAAVLALEAWPAPAPQR
jgi:hypothetical protein